MNIQKSNGNMSPNIMGFGNNVSINSSRQICNEVKTIQFIIYSLTKIVKEESVLEVPKGEINPSKKIDERFAEYSEELKLLYTDLYIKYGDSYQNVLSDIQIGRTEMDDVASFLRQKSIPILQKLNFKPIEALEELCSYLESNFFDNVIEDFEFSYGALKYFLYDQLIKCNVFPNPNDYKS